MNSDKYKILSCDPKDEMIPELSSLKNGITRAILKSQKSSSKGTPSNPLELARSDMILPDSECLAMFECLKEIFTLNLTKVGEMYAQAKTTKNKKKDDDCERNNQSIELNYLDDKEGQENSDGEYDVSAADYSAHSVSYLDKSGSHNKYEMDKKSIIEGHQEYANLYCTAMKDVKNVDEKDSLHKTLIKYYVPDDHERIEKSLRKVKNALCKLDSAGLTFYHIFVKASERNQYKLFKHFLVNLKVWGSCNGLNVYDYGVIGKKVARGHALNQLQTVFESVIDYIYEENTRQYPFLKLLTRKVGSIACYLNHIESSLDSNLADFPSNSPEKQLSKLKNDSEHFTSEDEENQTLLESNETEIQEDSRLIDRLSDIYDGEISEIDDSKTGYLIPLTCGHCGFMNTQEKTHYLNHLEASILKR